MHKFMRTRTVVIPSVMLAIAVSLCAGPLSIAIAYLVMGLMRAGLAESVAVYKAFRLMPSDCWHQGKALSHQTEPFRELGAHLNLNEASLDWNHKAPLQSRWQVNCRDHAARAATAELNRRKFKRHESRVAAQSCALVPG